MIARAPNDTIHFCSNREETALQDPLGLKDLPEHLE